jgi:hypothetical protein
MIIRALSLAALAVALAVPAAAQTADKPAEKAGDAIPAPNRVTAKRAGTFGGIKMNYTAIAGET